MKREKRLLVLLLVVLGIINISLFRKGHPNASDHAAYLIQTKSIVEGSVEKYSEMANFRKNNSIVIISPALYPWGFPLLLSPIYAIWGMNLFAHKTFIYIFFLVSCYFIYLLFKNKLNTKYIFSIIILICFNPYFFFFKDWIVSDIPHMMFALMSMYLIDRFVIQKKFIVNIYISYLILGLVLFWTYYIRKQGLVLIPYLLTIQIIEYLREDVKIKMNIKKVFQESIPLVTFFIINLFSAYILFAVGRSDYSNAFEIEIIKHNIIPNIIYYLTLPVGEFNVSFDYILPLYVVVVIDIVYILFVIIIFYGMLIRGKRDYLFAIFIVYNIVLLIIFPYKGGLRFLFPIIPFCLYFFYLGLLNIHQVFFIRKLLTIDKSFTLVRKINVLMVAFASVVFIVLAFNVVRNGKMINDGPYSEDHLQIYEYILANTEEKDVIVYWQPRILTLQTDRLSIFINKLEINNYQTGDYFILKNENLSDLDQKLLLRFDKTYSNNSYTIFKKLY